MGKKKRNKSAQVVGSTAVASEIRQVTTTTTTTREETPRNQSNSLPATTRTGLVEWLLLAASSVISFFVLATRFTGVNVSVLKDEYIYVLDSHYKDVSGFRLPNELFQFVFSSTKLCGENFYDCARGLNAAFVVGGALLIYFLVKLVTQGNRWLPALAGLATIFGTYGTYAAYFMPEAIFNFLMVAFFYLLIKYAQSDDWRPWVGMGLVFALASVSKPHAFFVLPAILLFVVLAARSNTGAFLFSLTKRLGLLLSAIFLTNISISWLSQRNQPTNVFGTYGAAVSSPEALAETLGAATLAQVPGTLFGQTLMIVMSFGLALPIGIIAVLSVLKSGDPGYFARNRAGALIGLALANMVAVTAVFEAWVGLYTWMHTRYYSYLIPLAVVVLAEAWANKSELKTTVKQIVTIAIFAILSGIAFFTMAIPYSTNWVDAPDFKFHIDNPAISGFLIIATLIAGLIYLFHSKSALLVAFVLLSTAYLGAGIHITSYLHQTFGEEIVSDDMARILRNALPQEQVDRTVIVGSAVVEMDRALFGLLSGSARAHVVSKPSSDLSFIKPEDMWLVTLGEVQLQGLSPSTVTGLGFSMHSLSEDAKISPRKGKEFEFSSKCVLPENIGWSCGPETSLLVQGGVQGGAVVDVIFEVHGEEEEIVFALGSSIIEGKFKKGVWATTLRFSGEGTVPDFSIKSTLEEPSQGKGEVKLVRLLHLGVS
jgi:phosphoglycerol transferase